VLFLQGGRAVIVVVIIVGVITIIIIIGMTIADYAHPDLLMLLRPFDSP